MAAYKLAADAWEKWGDLPRQIEALAGQVRVLLAMDKVTEAETAAATMLTYLADNNLNGANDPVQVYLTCYKLLTALDNPEAKTWLHQGQNWLEQRRAALTNQNLRDSFLNRIPSHREVCVQALEIGG